MLDFLKLRALPSAVAVVVVVLLLGDVVIFVFVYFSNAMIVQEVDFYSSKILFCRNVGGDFYRYCKNITL